MSLSHLTNLLSYALWGAPALAALAWATYKLKGKNKDKTEDQGHDQADQEPGLSKLRTRPLKPSVDLEIYTFM